jgi:hypothetical protein
VGHECRSTIPQFTPGIFIHGSYHQRRNWLYRLAIQPQQVAVAQAY